MNRKFLNNFFVGSDFGKLAIMLRPESCTMLISLAVRWETDRRRGSGAACCGKGKNFRHYGLRKSCCSFHPLMTNFRQKKCLKICRGFCEPYVIMNDPRRTLPWKVCWSKGRYTIYLRKRFSHEMKQVVITNDTLELPNLCAKYDLDVH